MNNDRVIKDGKVAVLVSPGYGGSWSYYVSGEYKNTFLFCPPIVNHLLECGEIEASEAEALMEEYTGLDEDDLPYVGGASQLHIVWVEVGTKFRISEYDGAECLVRFNPDSYTTA